MEVNREPDLGDPLTDLMGWKIAEGEGKKQNRWDI
jgi:hypothetical protein